MREALLSASFGRFSGRELVNRFEQFLIECFEIIPGVAQELAAGRVTRIGGLIDRSQDAAEQWLGNQVPETIGLVRLAREIGAPAASAFGAGFGGSVWALVKADDAESFKEEWAALYSSRFPESAKRSEFFLTCAGPSMIEFAN
jgi:galactokinase